MNDVGVAEKQKVASLLPGRMSSLAVVNDLAIRDLISLDTVIKLVRQAMIDVSTGRIVAPERWTMPVADEGALALMPGANLDHNRFGIKVLSLFNSPGIGPAIPGHQGLMLLFDARSGRPLSIIDAHTLTGMRTAAASAVATDLLARPDSTTLAMIGCGEQARWHVRALCQVRPIKELRVWSRSPSNARDFAAEFEDQELQVVLCPTVRHAIESADIICTVTRSVKPVVQGDWLLSGQHLNLVGSSTSLSREVDEKAVALGRFFVDSRVNALSQAGELRAAIAAGVVSDTHIHAEIGKVLAGHVLGREGPEMITIYKSLGHIAQDLAVAMNIHEHANQSLHTVWSAW